MRTPEEREGFEGDQETEEWLSGIIEVQFEDGVFPASIERREDGSIVLLRGGIPLENFNALLRKYRITDIARSFSVPVEECAALQKKAREQGVDAPNLANFMTLRFPDDADTVGIAAEFSELPEVKWAAAIPDSRPPKFSITDPHLGESDKIDSSLCNQWYIFRCRANRVWNLLPKRVVSGEDVIVADIDWGFRLSHEDLRTQYDPAGTFNSYDGGQNVGQGKHIDHGTAVAGLAVAARNGLGIVGFAFGARLWPIQANAGKTRVAPLQNPWADGIVWALKTDGGERRKVLLLENQTKSKRNYESVPTVNAAILNAIGNGVIVCVTAGNGGYDASRDANGKIIPPTGSILVGYTEYSNKGNPPGVSSNWGNRIVVSAPGAREFDVTCSSLTKNQYRCGFGGTSGAAAKVAGTIALMLEMNRKLTHSDIARILRAAGPSVTTAKGQPMGSFLNAKASVEGAMKAMSARKIRRPASSRAKVRIGSK